ncbi:hypothetical protein [Agromyces sp. GXQ0307]|uniref:hypothetical protein n=1 Tax=Agromyces sp. GXQ0307 TaxID=3377835 RepID=UPI00383AB9E9
MSTGSETQPTRERSVIYIVTVAVLVVVAAIALFSFLAARQDVRAEDQAEELIQALEAEGVDVRLTPEQVASVLGDDGGAVCANPNGALSRAVLLDRLTNGAGGPGLRATIVEQRLLTGQLLIIETYCPDELDEFQEFVDGLYTVDGNDA